MSKEDAIKLFETVLIGLVSPFGLFPIMDKDSIKDISKTVYVSLNEKNEPDGIVEVAESEE